MTQRGWLIELKPSVSGRPAWWALCPSGELDWLHDHMEGIRYARKIDAERVIASHGWTEAFARPASDDDLCSLCGDPGLCEQCAKLEGEWKAEMRGGHPPIILISRIGGYTATIHSQFWAHADTPDAARAEAIRRWNATDPRDQNIDLEE